jgi:DNA-binding IclR family transcriptional regulator
MLVIIIDQCSTLSTKSRETSMAVQSVDRALDILTLFSLERPFLGLTEISRSLHIAKPTAYGLITTLKERGFLRQNPETRKYHLGIRAFEVGAMFAGTSEIHQKALRKAHELEAKTGLIIRMGAWDRDSVIVILERSPNFFSITPPRQIGPRIKAYCTALGRVFLAFQDEKVVESYLDHTELLPLTPLTKITKEAILAELERARKCGYVLIDREVSLNHSSIACPVYNVSGEIAASISITGDPSRITCEEREQLVGILMQAAEDISVSMGHSLTSMATVSNR